MEISYEKFKFAEQRSTRDTFSEKHRGRISQINLNLVNRAIQPKFIKNLPNISPDWKSRSRLEISPNRSPSRNERISTGGLTAKFDIKEMKRLQKELRVATVTTSASTNLSMMRSRQCKSFSKNSLSFLESNFGRENLKTGGLYGSGYKHLNRASIDKDNEKRVYKKKKRRKI